MRYQSEDVEEVRVQNDIVEVISGYIPLKQKGGSYFGLCPFHNESTPSFSVSPDKQLYYCFGCGAAGNVFSFVMQMEGYDFVESLKHLADRANITLSQQEYSPHKSAQDELKAKLYEIHKIAGLFYHEYLNGKDGKDALEYFEKREISLGTQRKFGLGLSPRSRNNLYEHLKSRGFDDDTILKSGLCMKNKKGEGFYDRFYGRIMFPIFDVSGRCIGFGGRITDRGEPKYLNSPETLIFNKKQTLYGLNLAKSTRTGSKELIIVEGYMDMISIYQAGFHNVCASLGTAFNIEHARLIRRFAESVILIFDSDAAGETAALRAVPILISQGLKVKVLQVKDGKDPDEFIKQNGSKEFMKLLINAKSHTAFEIESIKKKYNLENLEQKLSFTKEAAKLLAGLGSFIEQDAYAKEISKETGISEEAIAGEIDKIRKGADNKFAAEAEKKRLRRYDNKDDGEVYGSKGILQAQRNLIFFCASQKEVYEKLRDYIKPEDFIDEFYIKFAGMVFERLEKNLEIVPAQAVNFFQNNEEQKKAAEVFALNLKYENLSELEKAVNEGVKLLKRTKADILAAKAETIEDIKQVVDIRKELESLNITL